LGDVAPICDTCPKPSPRKSSEKEEFGGIFSQWKLGLNQKNNGTNPGENLCQKPLVINPNGSLEPSRFQKPLPWEIVKIRHQELEHSSQKSQRDENRVQVQMSLQPDCLAGSLGQIDREKI